MKARETPVLLMVKESHLETAETKDLAPCSQEAFYLVVDTQTASNTLPVLTDDLRALLSLPNLRLLFSLFLSLFALFNICYFMFPENKRLQQVNGWGLRRDRSLLSQRCPLQSSHFAVNGSWAP